MSVKPDGIFLIIRLWKIRQKFIIWNPRAGIRDCAGRGSSLPPYKKDKGLEMTDPYKVLGIQKNATAAEIKRAYRRKVKELHPDSSGTDTSAAFNEVVKAYELLSDVRSRSLFDESFFMRAGGDPYRRRTDSWDYRTWLLARHDEESRAKLIFFDLMHSREDDAVAEFKRMCTEHLTFRLSHWFSREDFMDYGFILCEELVIRQEYYDAFNLLEQIILMERSFSYFRHFFPEVMDLARLVLKSHLDGKISDELAIDSWERALELGFGNDDDAFFLRKMGGAYRRMGDVGTARICEEEAARLAG